VTSKEENDKRDNKGESSGVWRHDTCGGGVWGGVEWTYQNHAYGEKGRERERLSEWARQNVRNLQISGMSLTSLMLSETTSNNLKQTFTTTTTVTTTTQHNTEHQIQNTFEIVHITYTISTTVMRCQ